MKTTKVPLHIYNAMCLSLEKAVAVYELLHSHAKGQTDLTEDQLANVVTGVSLEARDILREATGGPPEGGRHGPAGWEAEARARATARPGRTLNG